MPPKIPKPDLPGSSSALGAAAAKTGEGQGGFLSGLGDWASSWTWSDIGHTTLDVAGLIPGVGEAADAANVVWLAAEGNYLDALFSGISMIPGIGDLAGKGGKALMKIVNAGGPAATKAAKELLGMLDNLGIDSIKAALNKILPKDLAEKLCKELDDLVERLKKVAKGEADEAGQQGTKAGTPDSGGAGQGGGGGKNNKGTGDGASDGSGGKGDGGGDGGSEGGKGSNENPNGNPNQNATGGEPVDLITGAVFVEQTEFTLPWRLPISWKRHYSSQGRRRGAVGVGWECFADSRLTLREDGTVAWWSGGAAGTVFPEGPTPEKPKIHPVEGAVLRSDGNHWTVHSREGWAYAFGSPAAGNRELALRSITDPHGNEIRCVRTSGRLSEIRSSCGPWLELEWKDNFLVRIVLHHPSQPDRELARYAQSSQGDLTAVFDPLGVPHTFAYRNHCLVRHTDRNGVTFHYQYDAETAQGRCLHTWGDNGLFDTHIEYDLPQKRVRSTDSCGQVTLIEFDDQKRLTRRSNAFGEASTYEYDAGGRTSAVVDPLGRRTSYRYDDFGNLLELTRPDGATLRWEYDEHHCAVLFTDAAGHPWKQEFDARRRLTRQISPLGAVREYHYDARGDLLEYVNPRQAVTRFETDPCGTSLLRVTDALGHSSAWQIDSLGNVLESVDPVGAVTRFEYDAKSRLTRVLKPSGSEVRCDYDGELNLTRFVDELGHATRFEYGFVNRLVARHLPNGTTVRYDYDQENRLVAVINGRGERYVLQRDPAGRVLHEVDYWGRLTAYRYDPAGQLAESIDPLGRRTTFDRDPLGRLTARHFADGSLERFAYDPLGNLVATESPHGKVERVFDADGRLLAETQGEFSVQFGYDPVGNMVRRTSTAGNEVAYDYDPVNRLAALRVNGKTVLEVNRDARGLPVSERLGPNLWRYSEFDAEYRVTRQHTSVGEGTVTDRRYDYDRAGNLLQRKDAVKGTHAFGYDPVGNLIRHTDPEGRIKQFLRDAAGDFLQPVALESTDAPANDLPRPLEGGQGRGEGAFSKSGSSRGNEAETSEPRPSPLAPHPSDPPPFGLPRTPVPGREAYGHPIRAAQFGDLRYRYDAAGNVIDRRTKHGRTRFDWDCANRLIRGRGTDGIPVYMGYDAQGRRLSKTRLGRRITFGWDGDALMAEQGEHGWREYIMQPGGFTPVALVEGGQVFHFETDQVGLPHEILTTDGQVVWSADYDAWGRRTSSNCNRVDNPIRLQGQYADDNLGISYNRHRYYDPSSGSHLSIDPIGLLAGEELHRFAPNVWRWTDPLGLEVSSSNAPKKPYSDPKNRPKYAKGQVDDTWEQAKGPDGLVRDPNTQEVLNWDKSKSRYDQWHMGHKPEKDYATLHKEYMDGKISKEQFLSEYRNPNNYRPEAPKENMGHKWE